MLNRTAESFERWPSSQKAWLAVLACATVIGALFLDQADFAILVAILAAAVVVADLTAWFVWGRDRSVTDDASVLAAGPPAGLRPCLAVVLYDGGDHDRALGVALLELAERGLMTIHDDPLVGNGAYIPRVWIEMQAAAGSQRGGLGAPERVLAMSLARETHGHAKLDYVAVVTAIGESRSAFEVAVDHELTAEGWYRQPPFRTVVAWRGAADAIAVAGVFGVGVAILKASFPLLVAYVALTAAGWIGARIAEAMPVRTPNGAMLTGMLKAYRRSLGKTLAMSNSVWDVLRADDFAWFNTPDRMIVWAMALDLERDLTGMFARMERASVDDAWFPEWFGTTVPNPQRMFRSLDDLTGSAAS